MANASNVFHDLKHLIFAVERKVGKTLSAPADFEKLSMLFKRVGHEISGSTLNKVWHQVYEKEKPSEGTLNKIALFVGFQSWQDFKTVLHGNDSIDLHYDDSNEAKRVVKENKKEVKP